MARKGAAQIQKHFSNSHISSSSTNNPSYEKVGAKSIWNTNVRQLRHQTSFGGVSYLDVIKERERSDSGFSGDAYDELSNQDQFLNNISRPMDIQDFLKIQNMLKKLNKRAHR